MTVEQIVQLLSIIVVIGGFTYTLTYIVMGYIAPYAPAVLDRVFDYVIDKISPNEETIEIFCDVDIEDDYQIYI